MSGTNRNNLDPLFQLFEHYLLTRSYEDSSKFTKELANEYVAYLDSTPAHVPFCFRPTVVEDLESEAHEMLVKKMYGCVRSADYANIGQVMSLNPDAELAISDFNPNDRDDDNKQR